MKYFGLAVLVLCVGGGGTVEQIQEVEAVRHHDDDDLSAGTFLFGKLVLVPVLAAIGLKFLALLPIVLSKIALLSAMNFLSTNLNLLVSTLFGLKNFLGKHGLWAQEDLKKHPELETFAEYANQPFMPASFRYQYVMDKDAFLTTKSPPLTKVYNGGYLPLDGGFKAMTFDRRVRANDRRRYVNTKEQRSADGNGKYKCYWTSGEGDGPGLQYEANPAEDNRRYTARRTFDIADKPRVKPFDYGQQFITYTESNSGLDVPLDSYSPGPDLLYAYEPLPLHDSNDVDSHRQVATRISSAEKANDDGGTLAPFTGGQVKVAENAEQQQQQQYRLNVDDPAGDGQVQG